jgi:hypothetical protein
VDVVIVVMSVSSSRCGEHDGDDAERRTPDGVVHRSGRIAVMTADQVRSSACCAGRSRPASDWKDIIRKNLAIHRIAVERNTPATSDGSVETVRAGTYDPAMTDLRASLAPRDYVDPAVYAAEADRALRAGRSMTS